MSVPCIVDSVAQPLQFRMRPDLEVRAPEGRQDTCWIVKDPLSLQYYQLAQEEFEVLRALEPGTSLRQLQRHVEQLFAPARISYERLLGFVSRLLAARLIVRGDGRATGDDASETPPELRLIHPSGPLAIRFKGIDPGPVLDGLTSVCGWLFAPLSLLVAAAIVGTSLVLALVHHESVRAALPEPQSLLQGPGLVILILTIAAVKVLHELGHAIACRRCGGECHEIGLMLLLGVPTLYCDISDAWMIRGRGRRMLISAAGMYVELLLGSLCTWLWWFSTPGMPQRVWLTVALVCAVSTVLLNGNPLLRLDGYYLFSDLIGIPNLWQRSRRLWGRLWARLALGLESEAPGSLIDRRPVVLYAYGLLSFVYRLVVLCGVVWMAQELSERLRQPLLADVVLWLVVVGLLLPSAIRTWTLLMDRGRRRLIRPIRAVTALLVLAGAAWGAAAIPLPRSIAGPALLEVAEPQFVFAQADGRLTNVLPAGSPVRAGETLARFENGEIEREVERLRGELERQRVRVEQLRAMSLTRGEFEDLIPQEEEHLQALQRQYRERVREQDRLELKATRDGMVLSPPNVPQQRSAGTSPQALGEWWGTPLESSNAGSWIHEQTWLCTVGDLRQLEALVILSETDVDFVRPGEAVQLRFRASPERDFTGTVVGVGRSSSRIVPRLLQAGGDVPLTVTGDGEMALTEQSFYARVRLHETAAALMPGLRGTASIRAGQETLANRLKRWVRRNFQF